jgi:uncharacterized protein YydD (DUF2326 family)
MPQLSSLKFHEHKINKLNNMINMKLTWIKSPNVSSKMTTVQDRQIANNGEFKNIQAHIYSYIDCLRKTESKILQMKD